MKAQNIKLKNGLEIAVYRTTNDYYGNPRYIVHFLSLGLNDYVNIKGLNKYRGKKFGGGYVFQSYSVKDTTQYYYDMVQKINMNKFEKVLNEIDELGIEYKVYGDDVGHHAFVEMNSKYSIEVVDLENEIEVYAYHVKRDNEIKYFKSKYKTVSGTVKRIKKLYEELNE